LRLTFPLIIGAIAGLAALTILGGSFYTVDEGERAVITRNGKVVDIAEPGLHFKLPLMDTAHNVSVRTNSLSFDKEPTYSRDQQPADITFSITYSVLPAEVGKLYSEYGSIDGLESRDMTKQARKEVKNVFGQFNAVTAIQDRAKLNTQLEQALSDIGRGLVKVESVQVENIDFSDAYEQSVENRMLAEVEVQKIRQNAEREKVNAEIAVTQANARADSQRAEAQAAADAVRYKGEADAAAIKARGDAEAQIVRTKGAALRDNPDLIDLTKAERWNGVLPTTMVPGSAVPFINIK
jgi:regulator of protease activity HflC (stomatin/prohibitin superfamily)